MPVPLGHGTQLFKEELSPVKDGVKVVNDLAHQLAISDVHLSMENSRTLEQINTHWKQLQVGRSQYQTLQMDAGEVLSLLSFKDDKVRLGIAGMVEVLLEEKSICSV